MIETKVSSCEYCLGIILGLAFLEANVISSKTYLFNFSRTYDHSHCPIVLLMIILRGHCPIDKTVWISMVPFMRK